MVRHKPIAGFVQVILRASRPRLLLP